MTIQFAFLEFTERDILEDSGKASGKLIKAHAESDFDRVIKQIEARRKSSGNDE